MRVAWFVVGVGSLLCFIGILRSTLAAEPNAGERPASGGQSATTILAARLDDVQLLRRSRIWYVLSQDNGYGLLLGLPQRLGKAIVPSRRKEPMWQGVDDGVSVKLAIERDSDAGGEHLAANTNEGVELYSHGPDGKSAKAEVRFEYLSPDPLHPTEVVLRWREDKPVGAAAEVRPERTDKWKLAVGDMPDFKLVDTGGRTHRLADYRGKVVWLNFFGAGCGPCLAEWPHLVELSKKERDTGLVVLAICLNSAEVTEEFARRRGPPFAVFVDAELQTARQIRDDLPIPTNLLIDRDGRIAHLSEDFTDETFAELTAKARELLARRPTATSKDAD